MNDYFISYDVPEPPPLWREESSASASEAELLVERPSLQLQDLEGRIHKYEGLLSRKTKKATLKNGWKKRWFKVAPGRYRNY